MIKEINYPQHARIIIFKDGYIIADINTSGINGVIDADKIKAAARVDPLYGKATIELEV